LYCLDAFSLHTIADPMAPADPTTTAKPLFSFSTFMAENAEQAVSSPKR